MATSGTIGLEVFNTQKVIDNAYRGCRLPAQAITAEMITTAEQQLFLILSSLANAGAPLWCLTKYILPLYLGVYSVPCPVGTVDVMNANLRTLQRLSGTYSSTSGDAALAFDADLDTECVEVAIGGNITMELASASWVDTIGIAWGMTGDITFQLQYSEDGTTWTTFYASEVVTVVDREWLWLDFEGLGNHPFWRIVGGSDVLVDVPLQVRELYFGNNPTEINLARLNKDDYFYLPNKPQQGQVTQFWLDRQRDLPVMKVWQAPNVMSQFKQLVVLVHRQIMDVGTMRQELEVPQRWYNAVVDVLSAKLARITPEVKMEMIPITDQASERSLRLAWAEERDNSSINLAPDISPYTR